MTSPISYLNALAEQHRAQEAQGDYAARKLKAYQQAYRLGRLDRATKSYNPPGRSGDAAIYESADLMHRRTRDSYLNNPLLKRAVNVYRDLVVGTGINAFSDPVDYTFGWSLDERGESELEESFNFALESDELFKEWADSQFDISGNISFADGQAMSISENMLVGDLLYLESVDNRPGRIVPLCYQAIERDQIDITKDRPSAPGQYAIVNGFEIDEFGREIACYIYDNHPFSNYASSNNSTRVPAERYHHIFKRERPSQSAGATWLHATGQSIIDRNKWFETEMRSAIKGALMALLYQIENPGASDLGFFTDEDPDPLGRAEIALGTDPVAVEIGKDEKVSMIESTRPNNTFDKFFDQIDHDIAGAANLSFYSLTGRFERTNYGGFRGAMNLEDYQIRPVQLWLGRKMILPIRRRFNEMAVATGQIKSITPAEFKREMRRYQRFDIIGPGRSLLEPSAEIEATAGLLRGALTTLKIECARRGLHWIAVLRQIALENRILEWFKIVADFSKGQGGQVEKNSRSGSQDTEQPQERRWSA